jgi:hypothetical protein
VRINDSIKSETYIIYIYFLQIFNCSFFAGVVAVRPNPLGTYLGRGCSVLKTSYLRQTHLTVGFKTWNHYNKYILYVHILKKKMKKKIIIKTVEMVAAGRMGSLK